MSIYIATLINFYKPTYFSFAIDLTPHSNLLPLTLKNPQVIVQIILPSESHHPKLPTPHPTTQQFIRFSPSEASESLVLLPAVFTHILA